MYTRLDSLYYATAQELRDPKRIKSLCRHRRNMPFLVPWAFGFGGVAGLGFAALIIIGAARQEPLKASIGALLCVGTSLISFWTAKAFTRVRNEDPLRGYLMRPNDFEFREAKVIKATYQAGDHKKLDRMIVEGTAQLPDGMDLTFFEFVSPPAWPYVNAHGEDFLKPGDDWYDKKGQRPKLPIAVAVIYAKKNPEQCALAGILKK